MNNLLAKLLVKRGITRKDLDDKPVIPGVASEKDQFEQWEKLLSGEEVTVKNIEDFCKYQIGQIEKKWEDFSNAGNEKLVMVHTVYNTILKAISAPKAEREALEKYLIQLLNS